MQLRLRLPWPGPELSPNTRSHWAALATAKKRARRLAAQEVQDQIKEVDLAWLHTEPLVLILSFVRPTLRNYDRDNLVARSKALIDGMCDALRVDDKRFATLVSQVASEVGGFIRVTIQRETELWPRS